MILYRWRGETTNFGDELNTILWPRLLPGFFDDDPSARFLGIGSVLDRRHPAATRKLVAGAAYGGYEGKPALDATWTLHWVRGPRTAAAFGLPKSLGLGDPAVLMQHALSPHSSWPSPGLSGGLSGPPIPARASIGGPDKPGHDDKGTTPRPKHLPADRYPAAPSRDSLGTGIGFMPHFESAARGAWQRAADLAGVTMIDPRDPPLEILTAIARCRVLLSEALHGIIVADAMRVPWVAIRPLARIHRPKWRDWAETVDVVPRFATLPPSTLAEWFGRSPVLASRLQRHAHLLPAAEPMIGRAARALSRAAQAEPQLSPDAALERCQTRMLDAVVHLRRHPDAPLSRITPAVRRSYLRREDDSAYEPVPIG